MFVNGSNSCSFKFECIKYIKFFVNKQMKNTLFLKYLRSSVIFDNLYAIIHLKINAKFVKYLINNFDEKI